MLRAIDLQAKYTPSEQAIRFHESQARFRFLIWGVKSGKTQAGLFETIRVALSTPGPYLTWAVAPTYKHLQMIERELVNELYKWPGMIVSRNRSEHEIELRHGGIIQLRSAENPDSLRGPNVNFCWMDEASYVKREAWWIILERISATGGEVLVTTTPHGQNWVWNECRMSGMPLEAPYGDFQTEDGYRFVTHYPTWEFPWAGKRDIEEAKSRMPYEIFEQEFGAKFLSELTSVFRYIGENTNSELPPEVVEEPVVMGLDLAKFQDYTAVVIMGKSGMVYHVDRWTRIDWTIQRARIETLAKKWNCPIILDKANIGSTIDEDLRAAGMMTIPVEMNVATLKLELIQALQIAFERRSLGLPDPKQPWTAEMAPQAKQLIDELEWFECTLTRGGRPSYAAPSGLTDDLVISLALANWGRVKNLTYGAPSGVILPRGEWDAAIRKVEQEQRKIDGPKAPAAPRLQTSSRIFGRKTSLGFDSGDPFWGK